MKRIIKWMCILILGCTLTGCGISGGYDVKIVIPAGSKAEIVYSEEEISAHGSSITLSSGEGLGDTEVVLKSVGAGGKMGDMSEYMTPGMPVKMAVEKGAWYKVGVSVQNHTEQDIIVYVHVKNCDIRIE